LTALKTVEAYSRENEVTYVAVYSREFNLITISTQGLERNPYNFSLVAVIHSDLKRNSCIHSQVAVIHPDLKRNSRDFNLVAVIQRVQSIKISAAHKKPHA
jgi:hypothetical protein